MSFIKDTALFLVLVTIGMIIIVTINPLQAPPDAVTLPASQDLVTVVDTTTGNVDVVALFWICTKSLAFAPQYLKAIPGMPNAIADLLLVPYWIMLGWFIVQVLLKISGQTIE